MIIILSFILACMLQIRVNFLPVGHTHEDVDQFFSKISAHLSRVGAETINGELISLNIHIILYIHACIIYTFNPCRLITNVHNYSCTNNYKIDKSNMHGKCMHD